MRLLVDTHVLIWWWLDDANLPAHLRLLIGDRSNDIRVSTGSGWEIATKVRCGKLPEMAPHIDSYDQLVTEDGFLHLPIQHDHAVAAGLLRGAHRDPFDRMIAAQAIIEQLIVITCDPAFRAFGCEVLW